MADPDIRIEIEYNSAKHEKMKTENTEHPH